MDASSLVHTEAYRFMPIMDVYTHYRTQYLAVKESQQQLNINIEMMQQDAEVQTELDNIHTKQINDYIYILEKCQSLSKYVLILEDDVYAAQDFYSKILVTTNELKHKEDWIFLKLFFVQDFIGWNNDGYDFVFEIGVVVFSGVIAYLACKKFEIKNSCLVVLIVANAGLVGFGTIQLLGKQNIFPLLPSGLSEIEYTCCSPAHLYQSSKIPDLINFLKLQLSKRSVTHVDLLMDEYANQENLKKYVYMPSVFQHTGLKTTFVSYKQSHAFIWSETFEEIDSFYKPCL